MKISRLAALTAVILPLLPAFGAVASESVGFTSGSIRETFTSTSSGGFEDAIVMLPDDDAAVHQLQSQMRKRAQAFARGDFVDPTNPHGDLVPGLREMRDQWNKMHVQYENLPRGSRVRYTSSDPVMVEALHQWFTARAVNKIR